MNENKPAVPSPFEGLPERKPFTASRREFWAALLMYAAAYLYIDQDLSDAFYDYTVSGGKSAVWWLIGFTAMLIAITEILHWNKKRSKESWFWIGCVFAIELAYLLNRCQAWETGKSALFIHVFFVWWVLSRSGALLEGRTGRLLPVDAVFGFFITPFANFFLRIRCLFFGLRQFKPKKRSAKPETIVWSVFAIVLAAVFFWIAFKLLAGADSHFRRALAKLLESFTFKWDGFDDFIGTLILSLPVGAWLFGLIAGTGRIQDENKAAHVKGVDDFLGAIHGVPTAVWVWLTAAFCALYAVFFALHARYLLGAFTRNLPTGYTLSRYARQGFFELCKLMAVNFALLWFVTRLSRETVWMHKGLKIISIVLLAESLLFAVIAASKLWLYIDCFGFTPLRLQSAWLICSLAFGCVCAIWSIVRKKETFRAWAIFSAATLTALHFI